MTIHRIAVLPVLAVMCAAPVQAGAKKGPAIPRQITFSGEVAKWLTGCHVEVIAPRQPMEVFSGHLKAPSISLSLEKGLPAFFMFERPKGVRILAVLVDRFPSEPNFTIRLKRPTFEIKFGPHREERWVIRVRAHCTDDVSYSRLPYWNEKEQQVMGAKDPSMKMVLADDPKRLLYNGQMDSDGICRGMEGWTTAVDVPPEIRKGQKLQITVTYDTGDLWGILSLTKEYTVEW